MKRLIIAEKPSLASKIAAALKVFGSNDGYIENDNYIVTWVYGHLFTLKDIKDYDGLEGIKWKDISLPFVPDFEYKFSADRPGFEGAVEKQFNTIKSLALRDDVSDIFHAGDSEREGQLIIDEVLQMMNNKKPVFRLWLPDQTEETILNEVRNMKPNEEYLNLYNEALARSYIDWIIGINLTVYLSRKVNKTINVGRVIIPIIKYIYDRDIAIRNFKSEKYFQLESKTEKNNIPINLSIKKEKFKTKEAAEEFLQNFIDKKAVVKSITRKEIKNFPKKLYKLSTIQAEMSKKYKFPFKKTEDIIQKLYEEKFLTYPRTGSEYIRENEKDQIQKVINTIAAEGYNLELKDSKKIFDTSKVESHSALTPTTVLPKVLSNDEEKVYTAIFNRFVSNFLTEEAIISETIILIEVGNHEFKLRGKEIVQEGFYKYEPETFNNQLPNLSENEEFVPNFIAVEKNTEPPKKVSEEELSAFLESPFKKEIKKELDEDDSIENIEDDTEEYKMLLKGIEIGTPATRVQIIENAKKYNYITLDKSNYSITSFGEKVVELLQDLEVNLFKEQNIEFSKTLKKVYNEIIDVDEAVAEVFNTIKEIIDKNLSSSITFCESIGKCPKCGTDVLPGISNYYCSDYENCGFKLWKNSRYFKENFTINDEQAEKLLKNEKVSVELIAEGNKKRKAKLKMKINGEYVNFEEEKESIGKCLKCSGEIIEGEKNFYCANHKNGCDFKVWKEAKHYQDKLTINKNIMKKLLKKNGSYPFEITNKSGVKEEVELALKINGEYVNFVKVDKKESLK